MCTPSKSIGSIRRFCLSFSFHVFLSQQAIFILVLGGTLRALADTLRTILYSSSLCRKLITARHSVDVQSRFGLGKVFVMAAAICFSVHVCKRCCTCVLCVWCVRIEAIQPSSRYRCVWVFELHRIGSAGVVALAWLAEYVFEPKMFMTVVDMADFWILSYLNILYGFFGQETYFSLHLYCIRCMKDYTVTWIQVKYAQ